jgi:hypothetical protein
MAELEADGRISRQTGIDSISSATLGLGLLLLLLAVPLDGRAQEPYDVWDYKGDWVRSTEVQNFIVFLSVTPVSERQMSVRAWGRCRRKPEAGGTRADCENWGEATAGLEGSGAASLFQPAQREWWDLSLSERGGRLWVRVRDSSVAWTREPGVDLVRGSPPPDAPPRPPAQETCSITGYVEGPLQGRSYPDHGGGVPTTVRLTHILLTTADGTQQRVVPITNRRFTFANLRAGVVYHVFPRFFQSEPRRRELLCRANARHQADFRIIGPLPEG